MLVYDKPLYAPLSSGLRWTCGLTGPSANGTNATSDNHDLFPEYLALPIEKGM